MVYTIMGVNTGVIRHNDKFAALALKIKHPKNKQSLLFFPLVALKDLLLALEHRLSRQAASAGKAKEQQRKAIDSASKKMHSHIPPVEIDELKNADIGQRVNLVELDENGASELIFNFTLHCGKKLKLSINEHQIEVVVAAIIHAINNAEMREVAISLSSVLDFLPLYDADFLPDGNIAYDTYTQAEWKQALFSHHHALIYHYTDANGDIQYSGTVIKTRSLSQDDEMASVSRRVLDYSHRLNRLKGKPCQVSVKTLSSDKRHRLTLEQCMRSLHSVQQQIKQKASQS
ncbi:YjeJ family protein [Yokenella regensburgei]|uniref:YjeJ family protein n=1 Tax=Yokenella regensburgei TaxID=158877 RepID=UPI003F13E156